MNRYYKNLLKSTLIYELLMKIKLNSFKRKWVKNNTHNQTIPINFFDADMVKVGINSYGELNVISFSKKSRLFIGNYVSIAQNVTFLLDVEHYTKHLSTYPFRVKILETEKTESFSKGDIIVEDDVWIGYGVILLSGIHIGKGAIIAAGSIVTKDVEPYSIVAGVPAKLKKMRFDKAVENSIRNVKYELLDYNTIKNNIDILYMDIENEEKIELIKNTVPHIFNEN